MAISFIVRISLAILLLSSSAPLSVNDGGRWFAFAQHEIKGVAFIVELMDARESNFLVRKQEEFLADLTILRERATSLRYAPAIAEHERFNISRDASGEFILFNRGYKRHLEDLIALYPDRAGISSAIEETDRLYRSWDILRDSKTTYYYTHVRRQALLKLKEIIGAEMFSKGQMPPHVPYWRFSEVR